MFTCLYFRVVSFCECCYAFCIISYILSLVIAYISRGYWLSLKQECQLRVGFISPPMQCNIRMASTRSQKCAFLLFLRKNNILTYFETSERMDLRGPHQNFIYVWVL
eukprot:GEMP01084893.1.p1 GENE.GEMP01084893.1~~GEMP01084893.1.p1  ORF type:complete len:107 (+),score=0.03 GEMP01084893.1:591-911(+)